MSMELHVFFCGRLPGRAALQDRVRALGFPLSFRPASGSLERQTGYMPMVLAHRDETGIEFDVFQARDVADDSASGSDPRFDRAATFRWSSNAQEMMVAFACAAALAPLVNGVIFDPQEGKSISIDEALAFAQEELAKIRSQQAQARPGTSSADIRRYLKPLLKMRSDLVLRGRLLLIRPVRHLLRGALFDRTSDKYRFQIWRFFSPLYDDRNHVGVGHGDSLHMTVWEPHFEPLLFDTLSEDVLDRVAKMVTLSDFADQVVERGSFAKARARALILAGERDRAIAWIEECERRWPRTALSHDIAEERALLDRDIPSVCEEHHRLEAQSARQLKLDGIWEPTPFPAELPKARRATSNEAAFGKKPWIERPDWLLGELPQQPGAVLFATGWVWRKERAIPLIPIDRAQAEGLHRNYEGYCVLARLPRGEQLVVHRVAWWSRHDPDAPQLSGCGRTAIDLYVWVLKPSNYLGARFNESPDERGMIRLCGVSIYSYGHRIPVQGTSISHDDRKLSYMRWENDSPHHVRRSMADDEMKAYQMSLPAFGEFQGLLESMNACLALTERASECVRVA